MTALVSVMFYSPNDGPYLNNAGSHHPQEPHHHQELFQEVPSGISAEIHRKLVKIWASRLAFNPD